MVTVQLVLVTSCLARVPCDVSVPRSKLLVPEVKEFSDPGYWFQILKGLLILVVETLGQSRPLIGKGFNQTTREFSSSTLYKGLI